MTTPNWHNPEVCNSRECDHPNCKAYWVEFDAGYADGYQRGSKAGLAYREAKP